ncbi:Nicotinamide N-methyltransferase-like protein [Artemisia annua]|uniref:Nicotinamide N-methyltransferase-like protein n=1 Tax=Artemisia annua TaxID=35608 RepID=A0A2U1LEN7_ARTAN|nr:Nicotinamide N-methyltransferase-like protein [Artemisia annua]
MNANQSETDSFRLFDDKNNSQFAFSFLGTDSSKNSPPPVPPPPCIEVVISEVSSSVKPTLEPVNLDGLTLLKINKRNQKTRDQRTIFRKNDLGLLGVFCVAFFTSEKTCWVSQRDSYVLTFSNNWEQLSLTYILCSLRDINKASSVWVWIVLSRLTRELLLLGFDSSLLMTLNNRTSYFEMIRNDVLSTSQSLQRVKKRTLQNRQDLGQAQKLSRKWSKKSCDKNMLKR